MKIKFAKPKPKLAKASKPAAQGKRGPKTTIGGKRMNFFPGDCFKGLNKLNRLLKEAGVRRTITRSFALREGARLWIRQQIKDAHKAVKGELHAKRRRD
jgi:hypothetical protein